MIFGQFIKICPTRLTFWKEWMRMKKEGQVRIPSGCAIAAVIFKEGRKMTGC